MEHMRKDIVFMTESHALLLVDGITTVEFHYTMVAYKVAIYLD